MSGNADPTRSDAVVHAASAAALTQLRPENR